ncbi:MAG TPA: ribosome maturation factor RimM [Bryobacteraceae bacterium]|nr:ribosome maturation factor RimM [Bryobacteraceae bacterium]
MTPQTPEEWVWLARIRRPQGRKGEVLAEILTDFPQKFAERRQLWLLHESVAGTHGRQSPPSKPAEPANPPREVRLNNHWLHKGGVVLHFEGVESISDAEKLAGLMVAIPRAERAPVGEDEVYIADLVGCTLVDVANPDSPAIVGEIEDVERDAGPVPILIVRSAAGEVLIPFAKSYLRTIDLAGRRVEMALPEGLVDLNA